MAGGDIVEYRPVEEFDATELDTWMLQPAIQLVDTAIAGKDARAFQNAYTAPVDTCNA